MNLYELHTNPESLYGYEQIREKYTKPSLETCQQMMAETHGHLDFRKFPYSMVTQLPSNLTVDGELNINRTQITQLPDNLTVGESLFLQVTQIPITQLPDNLTINGSFSLNNTHITHIGDNLTVGKYLDLRNTPITHIGNNLTVLGYLYLENTPSLDKDNLPTDMQVLEIVYR
jgi:hypothetical protein